MRLTIRICAVILLVSCGCSEGDGRVSVYPVTGKLTINGKPADGAYLVFHPASGDPDALKPTATTDAQGNLIVTTYETGDGAPAGEYHLSIEWPKKVNNFGRLQNGPDQLGGAFADPEKSNRPVTVSEGPTELSTIDLKAQVRDVKPPTGPSTGDSPAAGLI